jgi:hypothetical protein
MPVRKYLRNNQSFHLAWATHFSGIAPLRKDKYPAILTAAALGNLSSDLAHFPATDQRRRNAETLMERLTQDRLEP